jgi:hypothetical protein
MSYMDKVALVQKDRLVFALFGSRASMKKFQ